MTSQSKSVTKIYRPVHVDRFQSAQYQHVATRVEPDGRLTATFADGTERPSVFDSEIAMLAAGQQDWRERMVLDASGRVIAPPQTVIVARPDGPWNQNGGQR